MSHSRLQGYLLKKNNRKPQVQDSSSQTVATHKCSWLEEEQPPRVAFSEKVFIHPEPVEVEKSLRRYKSTF